jgi:zinc/manganese transport system permease protein
MRMRTPADLLGEPHLSWNVAHDLSQVLEYHFMLNALAAGTVVAVLGALVGWLMVLRREAFAGHTLAMMAFPGASAAALAGVPQAWGYYAFCAVTSLVIGRLPRRGGAAWGEQSAGIGAIQALALALGFLFVSLYGGVLGDLESLLFGNLLGISDGQVLTLALVALLTLVALALLARPLLFASVDPDVAEARGLPVRALSTAFLLLLGLTVAATSQVTGPLLVFSLLVMPAASAQVLTVRPARALLLSVLIGLLVVWLGLGAAYFSEYPPGFYVTAFAFAAYVLARLAAWLAGGHAGAPVLEAPPRGVTA